MCGKLLAITALKANLRERAKPLRAWPPLVVRPRGLEPLTFAAAVRRSDPLSYGRMAYLSHLNGAISTSEFPVDCTVETRVGSARDDGLTRGCETACCVCEPGYVAYTSLGVAHKLARDAQAETDWASRCGGTGIRTPRPFRAYRFSRPAPCRSVIPPSGW